MSIATVVTEGYGSFGSIAEVVTMGYTIGDAATQIDRAYGLQSIVTDYCAKQSTITDNFGANSLG